MLYHCILRNETFPHYHAFVFARNPDELFWSLDEYSDPYSFEIYECENGFNFCVEICNIDEAGGIEIGDIDIGENTLNLIDETPNNPKFLVNKNGKLKLSTKRG